LRAIVEARTGIEVKAVISNRPGAAGLEWARSQAIATQVVLPMQKIQNAAPIEGWGSPMNVGKALFTHYAWPFEMASILLLIGIVGSILLAKRRI